MSFLVNWCVFFVLNSVWQLLVLIGVAALLVHVLPKLANGLQYRLWVSCLCLAVAIPVAATYLAVTPVHSSASAERVDTPNRWKVPRPPAHGRLTLPLTAVSTGQPVWSPFQIVAGFYIASLLFGVARFLLRLETTRRIVKTRIAVSSELPGMGLLESTLKSNKPAVGIFATAELEGPATVSWPAPLILLPLGFEQMSEQEKVAVMAHELAHVERQDFVKNLLLEVLSLALFYHPALPWLKRRIAECREAMCDEMAAEATCGRTTYALALLNVAQRSKFHERSRTGLALGIEATQLERRIMRLVQAPSVMGHRRKFLPQALCLSALASASVGILCFSLHPTSVQAAGMPAFPFDPSQTFDTLIPRAQRKSAPNFTLVDNNGKTITLSDYKGKVVLLDFWATWCGGCKLEIPWYMEFDRTYRKDGLSVIGVSMDDKGWDAVRPFLAKKRDDETGGVVAMQYPIVIGNDALGSRFGLTSMPMTLLIDQEGRIAVAHTGVVDRGNFEANIRQLLKQ